VSAENDTLVSVVNGTEYLNVTQLLSNETINTSNETTSNSTDYSWLQCAVTVYNGTNLTGNAWVIDPNVTVWFNDTNAEAPNATIYYALWNFRTPRVCATAAQLAEPVLDCAMQAPVMRLACTNSTSLCRQSALDSAAICTPLLPRITPLLMLTLVLLVDWLYFLYRSSRRPTGLCTATSAPSP
jgi:hypothetical protein